MTGLAELAGGLSALAGANGFKSLTLENFQSHVKTVVEFAGCGELTVIVGASDAGKTAVLRGLRWLLFNVPQGDSFVRVGATMARVTLELESGHKVVRERTRGGVNRYRIIVPGGGGDFTALTYEGFGNSVPLEVQELTGVKPVQIGDMELNLNIAEQLDGPFLGRSVSAGARAKVLGKLAGTEEIDFAGKELGTDLYRRNQDVKRLANELTELDNRIGLFSWLDGEAVRLQKLEQLVADVKVLQERRGKVSDLQVSLINVSEIVRHCRDTVAKYQGVELAESFVTTAIEARSRVLKIEHLRDGVTTLADNIADCEGTIDAWSGVEWANDFMVEAETAIAQRQQFASLESRYFKAEGVVSEAESVLAKLQGIDQADSIVQNICTQAERRQVVAKLQGIHNDIRQAVKGAEGILARLAGVDEAEKLTLEIADQERARRKVSQRKAYIGDGEQAVTREREQVVLWENRVAELQGAYQDELVSLGVCPVCGSIIDSERVREAC